MPAPRIVTVTIGLDPPPRLDKALARDVDPAEALSRSRIARLIEGGAVARGGAVERSVKAAPAPGETWEIAVPPPTGARIEAQDIPLTVVWEDAHLVVVDKPAGMVVHPAPGSPDGTLVNALMHRLGGDVSGVGGVARPGIVHRIDKDTSGLLVAAKSDAAHHGLAAQFEAHEVDRLYRAICHGVPDAGDARLMGTRGVRADGPWLRIETRLDRHRTDRQRQAVFFDRGRHAVTRVRTVRRFGSAALVECRLETGRTHQIRVHMAHAGHALIGDGVYGGRRRLPSAHPGAAEAAAFPRQALHAAVLGFAHPVTGEALRFESPPPDDMAGLLSALAGDVAET